MIVAYSPTSAATVGRLNHVEVLDMCWDLERVFQKKKLPSKAGQIFVAHAIFIQLLMYPCKGLSHIPTPINVFTQQAPSQVLLIDMSIDN